MAATHRNRSKPSDPLYEKTRKQIQTTQLVKRMNANSLGKLKTEMTPGQIATSKTLLDKVLPNLQSTELSSPDGKPVFAVNIHEKQEE